MYYVRHRPAPPLTPVQHLSGRLSETKDDHIALTT